MEYLKECNNISQLKLAIKKIKNSLLYNLYSNSNISAKELKNYFNENKNKFENKWLVLKKEFCSIFKIIEKKIDEEIEWKLDKQLDFNYEGFLYCYLNNSLFSLRFPQKVKFVSASPNNTIHLITINHDIYVKGSNNFQQTGIISDNNEIKEWTQITKPCVSNCSSIYSGYAFTHFLTPDKVYSCGNCDNGRLGNNLEIGNAIYSEVDIDENIMKIATGSTNSYFLSKTGNVYSCGHKYYLGFYSDKDLSKPHKITFPTKYKIIDIVANSGSYHCLALDSNGKAYSWGHNRVGQLGICPKDESMKPLPRI